MKCWLRGHDWIVFSWFNYYDTSVYDAPEATESNSVTLICQRCKKLKVIHNFGGGHIDREYLLRAGVKNLNDKETK